VLALLLAAATPVSGQPEPVDLTHLSMEELTELEAIQLTVLGGHVHYKGQWMIGYRYSFMEMDGNRDGTQGVAPSEVLESFPVTPTKMSMEMQMVEVMWAPTNKTTLMVMVPLTRLTMDHRTRSGVRFTTSSDGIGDVTVMALHSLYETKRDRLFFNAGLSVPSGSITRRGNTPAGNLKLPYPMRLGSGTYDLLPGMTYSAETKAWGWGGQVLGSLPLGENDSGYTLGDRIKVSGWLLKKLRAWAAVSVQVVGESWSNIDGADPDLNPRMVPTADPTLRAGERVDFLLGLSFYSPKGPLKGHRLLVEAGQPIYQSLNGPQLEVDWRLNVGWNWTH